jgi:nitrate reductase assembly molybdenum cofactor insertion protein NarJ
MTSILDTVGDYYDDAQKKLIEIQEEVELLRKRLADRHNRYQVAPNEMLAFADERYKLEARAEYYRGIADFSRDLIRRFGKQNQ